MSILDFLVIWFVLSIPVSLAAGAWLRHIDPTRLPRSYMARTIKKGYNSKGNIVHDGTTRAWFSRERKWARKQTNRKARGIEAEAMRTFADPEDTVLPKRPSTGGWISH